MVANDSLKIKIISSMVGLSLLTTLVISCTSVVKSSEIIRQGAKESFAMNAKISATDAYSKLKQVEDNVSYIAQLSANATSISKVSDKNILRSSKDSEYSKTRLFVKTLAENTKWAQSVYFYFDQKYIPSYDGAWYIKKNGKFTRNISNSFINDDDANKWYYNPIKQKKPVWSSPYVDNDLKVTMITYSMPVYKNGFLLGLTGMDITLDELNKLINDIKIYNNTSAFLVAEDYEFIAGKGFNVGENVLQANNGKYAFLKEKLSTSTNGTTEYKDGITTKVVSYSKLPNGFILVIEVPLKDIPTNMSGTIFTLVLLALVSLLITAIAAIKLGDFISLPINNAVKRLSDYARSLTKGALEFLETSQKLAEGSSEQAASVQETSSTLEESQSIVHQNNENTKHAVDLAKNAKKSADIGNKEMKEMMSSMDKLYKSSSEIKKIAEVINKIAFQTNLLALNAAVEAARAGDAGAGFSVVAEEVRNLAKRSAEASNDIADIVKTNLNLTEHGVKISAKVNSALEDINLQAQKVNDLLDEIATSSNEQSIGISQISLAMSQIEQVVQLNANQAEQAANTSEDFSHFAEEIMQEVSTIERIVNGDESTPIQHKIPQSPKIQVEGKSTKSIPQNLNDDW